jgi:cell division protein FtsB
MCPFPNSSFISNSLLASELVFSLLCLLFSFMIWVLVFNLINFKQLLLQIEAKNTDLQKAIRELERKLELELKLAA